MNDVETLITLLKNLPQTVKRAVDNVVINENVAGELNKKQLNSGLNAEGGQLGQYAESTKRIRARKGLQTNYIDLNFTGKFQDSITTEKDGNGQYSLTATDSKWEDELKPQERFSKAVGIQKENEDKITEIITGEIEFITDQLFS